VTAFAAVLDLATGELVHVSAGHDSAFALRAGAPPERLVSDGGPPLGTIEDFPYPVDSWLMAPGDVLLLYTDGVTEAEDSADRFYTAARLEELLIGADTTSARALVEYVREDLRRFVGTAEQADDITLLAIRWPGPAE
jgi:sigma-B regulation protein RsbU (phosphoserine phosphatase)